MGTCGWVIITITETWLKKGQNWQLCTGVIGEKELKVKKEGELHYLIRRTSRQWTEMISLRVHPLRLWMELRNKKGIFTLLGVYFRSPNSNRKIEQLICQEIAVS